MRPRSTLTPVPPSPSSPSMTELVSGLGGPLRTLPGSQGACTFQGVVRLVQVQEDHVQDLIPQGCKLLKQLGLEGGSTRAATRLKSM